MKKLLSLFLALILIVPCCFIFAACGKEPPPVLQVENLNSTYYFNEDLITDGVKLIYNNDERESKVDLERSMVQGYYATSVGTRTLKINYLGHVLEKSYSILNIAGPKFVATGTYTVDAGGNKSEVTALAEGQYETINFERNGKFTLVENFGNESSQEGTFSVVNNINIQSTAIVSGGGSKIINFNVINPSTVEYCKKVEGNTSTYVVLALSAE